VLGLAFAGLNTVHAGVNFNFNPGFEDGTVVPGLPGQYGANTAHPWSFWGNNSPVPNGAIANPVSTVDNSSARVWACFNNPYYVNAASQNDSILRPATGFWLVPGASYHFHAQAYVPSSEIVLGTTTARLGLTLSMSNSNPSGQATMLRPLDARFYEVPTVEPPTGPITPVISPVVIPDQWNTYDFDWTFAGPLVQYVQYPAARLYGGDGRYLGRDAGTPPANPLVAVPNPGGYFDNFQISSDVYRNDLRGFVKDELGNPFEGALVTLTSPFTTAVDTATTLADGSYTLPTWAPFGYEFSVNATYPNWSSDGPKTLAVSGSAGEFPLLTMVPEPSTLVLLAAGVLGLVCYAWRRRRA
jgi:hypothetical protein